MQSGFGGGYVRVVLRLNVDAIRDTQDERSCHAIHRASNISVTFRTKEEDALPQMGHEVVGRFQKALEEFSCHLEFPWTIGYGCVRVEELMEDTTALPPIVPVAHKDEVPVAADPTMSVNDEVMRRRV